RSRTHHAPRTTRHARMPPMLKTLVWEREAAADAGRRNGRGHFRELEDPAQISDLLADEQHLLWLDLVSPSADELRLITQEFSLHPLAVEDAAQHQQRPKIDEYDNFYLMVVFAIETVGTVESAKTGRAATPPGDEPAARSRKSLPGPGRFTIHEIDLFIGERFLITV